MMPVIGFLLFIVVIGLCGLWPSHINADRENWSDEERRQAGVAPKGQRMRDVLMHGPARMSATIAVGTSTPSPRFAGPSQGAMLATLIPAWAALSWLLISAARPSPGVIHVLILLSMWPVAVLCCVPLWAFMRHRARAARRG